MVQERKSGLQRWGVPIVTIAAAVTLGTVVLLQGMGGGPGPAGTPTGSSPTEIISPEKPALPKTERREANDKLAYGPVDAPVGLVVFSDYQCQYCARWHAQTLPALLAKAEAGQLRIEWRDANIFGPDSRRAALAAYAAGQQGKFREFHGKLFEGGKVRGAGGLSEPALAALAESLGLDMTKWRADVASPAAAAEVTRNEKLAQELQVFSTPSFVLGGKPLVGAQPTEVFVQAFEAALKATGR